MSRRCLLVVALTSAVAAAEPRWSVGLAVGVPGDGSGIPVAADSSAHLPMSLVGAWRWTEHLALSFGFGLPVAGEGASGWLGAELSLVMLQGRVATLRLYGAPGLQLGFVGPQYYAAHSHVFVGWEYIYSGPFTPSLRAPLGASVRFGASRVEAFAEFVPVLSFVPTVNAVFGGALGVRVYVD